MSHACYLFIHLFNKYPNKCLLYMRHCVRHWVYSNEENEFSPKLVELTAQEILNE